MKEPREQARQLVDQFSVTFGERLRGALIYGSVARGEAVPGVSDINVLVLFDELDAPALALAGPIARKWAKAGQTPPLIMEWDQWCRAGDVFAIEVADMRDAHVPLRGEDVVKSEVPDLTHLRVQAERELRGKLLQLQTGILLGAEDGKELGKLLQRAMPSFATYLRAAIRLAGKQVPVSTPDVIRQGMALAGGSPDAFLEAWQTRTQKRALRANVSDPIVDAYHTAAEQIAEFVDTCGR